MNLYEVRNGYIGESYVRVYIWCRSEAEAVEMARSQFAAERTYLDEPEYSERLTAHLLFSSDAAPFVTEPSDSGLDMPEHNRGGYARMGIWYPNECAT